MMSQYLSHISSKILLAFILALFCATALLLPPQASAQIENPAIGSIGRGIGAGSNWEGQAGSLFSSYFVSLWQGTISIGAITVLVMYINASVEWISAGGDSGKIEKARTRMTNATIGLILLTCTFIIVGFISQLLFGAEFQILNFTLISPQSAVP